SDALALGYAPPRYVCRPKDGVETAALAKPVRPPGRRRKRRLSTWLRPTAVRVSPKDGVETAARAKPVRPPGRHRKRRLSTWLRPNTVVPVASPRASRPPEKSSRAS